MVQGMSQLESAVWLGKVQRTADSDARSVWIGHVQSVSRHWSTSGPQSFILRPPCLDVFCRCTAPSSLPLCDFGRDEGAKQRGSLKVFETGVPDFEIVDGR